MPRFVIGRNIELHYQSPSEMVSHLSDAATQGKLTLETATPPVVGSTQTVVIHIPWLGQVVKLSGRVESIEGQPPAAAVHLALENGPHDTLAHLAEFIGRFRTGAILEDAREAPAGGSVSPEQRIRAMSPNLRAMLAAKANPEERMVLSRDPDPRVV